MSKDKIKFEAPVGCILSQAYREESILFEKEGNMAKALQYRRVAEKMEAMRKNVQRKNRE